MKQIIVVHFSLLFNIYFFHDIIVQCLQSFAYFSVEYFLS